MLFISIFPSLCVCVRTYMLLILATLRHSFVFAVICTKYFTFCVVKLLQNVHWGKYIHTHLSRLCKIIFYSQLIQIVMQTSKQKYLGPTQSNEPFDWYSIESFCNRKTHRSMAKANQQHKHTDQIRHKNERGWKRDRRKARTRYKNELKILSYTRSAWEEIFYIVFYSILFHCHCHSTCMRDIILKYA